LKLGLAASRADSGLARVESRFSKFIVTSLP
jgi:hypothetical protein